MFCKSSSSIRGGGEKTLRISGDLKEGKWKEGKEGEFVEKKRKAQKSKKEEKRRKKKTPPLPPLSVVVLTTHIFSRLLARAKAIIH